MKTLSRTCIGKLLAFLHAEDGLTVTEYAIAAGLIAATLAAALQTLGTSIDALITSIVVFL